MSILKVFAGKKSLQKIYEKLYLKALTGMHYGGGVSVYESGEINVMEMIKQRLRQEKSLTVFDVGANIGSYSNSLYDVFGNNATIHAFEPSEKTFKLLAENTSKIPTIVLNNAGISDQNSVTKLYTNQEASGIASVYQRNLEHFGTILDKSEEIKLITIDNYCIEHDIDRIHFLKLDIEGHELSALKGAKQMLDENKIDYIQFEFGGCNIDSRTYFQDFYYLLKDTYRIYRILKDGLIEIPDYKETFEIFITVNYLAERRR